MMKLYEEISLIYGRLERNEKIKKHLIDFPLPNASLNDFHRNEGFLKGTYLEFYVLNDGLKMEWTSDKESNMVGRIRIVALKDFVNGIKFQLTYLNQEDKLYFFHPLDLIADEANCGVYAENGQIVDRMYYNVFGESEVYDLQIDFYAYLQLANMARGYFYWPKYLLEKITGEKSVESDDFQKNMPEIFPDFKLEEFDKLFESSRK